MKGTAALQETVIMGILIGAVFGLAQISLLIIGVRSLGGGKLKVWPFVVQFLCPLLGLLLCALVARNQLLMCACVIVGILIIGAVIEFFRIRKKDASSGEKRDK